MRYILTVTLAFMLPVIGFTQNIERTVRPIFDPTRELQAMQMVPVCAPGTPVAVSGTRLVCGSAMQRNWYDFSAGKPDNSQRYFARVYKNTDSRPRPIAIRLTDNLDDNQANIYVRDSDAQPWRSVGGAPDDGIAGIFYDVVIPVGGSYSIDTSVSDCVGKTGPTRPAVCNTYIGEEPNANVTWLEYLPYSDTMIPARPN